MILDFLKSEAKISSSSQAMMASGDSQNVPRQTTGIHLAAYFGLIETTTALGKRGQDPNYKDTYARAPLSWAAERGHEVLVELQLRGWQSLAHISLNAFWHGIGFNI